MGIKISRRSRSQKTKKSWQTTRPKVEPLQELEKHWKRHVSHSLLNQKKRKIVKTLKERGYQYKKRRYSKRKKRRDNGKKKRKRVLRKRKRKITIDTEEITNGTEVTLLTY